MRRTSVSLPTKHAPRHDPHEKSARYDVEHRRDAGILEKLTDKMISQAQKVRYVKTGAIIFLVLLCIYYLSPSGVDIYNGGMIACLSIRTGLIVCLFLNDTCSIVLTACV